MGGNGKYLHKRLRLARLSHVSQNSICSIISNQLFKKKHGKTVFSVGKLLFWISDLSLSSSLQFLTGRNWTAAKDMQRYRHCYPILFSVTISHLLDNQLTLHMLICCNFFSHLPRFFHLGLLIDELLEAWQEDYETLEENHSYIQWLFPLREHGMNWRAKPLTCKEIQAFKESKEVMQRFIRAYKLMLGFYGINLIDQETGEVRRAENWRQRFRNLDRFSHNNLRITRILKCLGEMGYEHYQVCLVKFFLTETLVFQTLPNVKRSALDYFLFTIRNKQKRRELIHYAWMHFKPQDKFAWGPHKKLQKYKLLSLKSQHCQKAEDEKESVRDKEAVGKNETSPPDREEKVGDAAYSETNKSLPSRPLPCLLFWLS
uniref:Opioid growth factor receptor (OGFr) conserved domain-containing protein n=1 Tax=Chelonoidis abingdonii TaxID=106734 RepID=A0A8C0IML6_CHEAB